MKHKFRKYSRTPRVSNFQFQNFFFLKFEENFDNIWKLMESDYKFFQIDKNVLKRHSLKIPNAQNPEHSKSRYTQNPDFGNLLKNFQVF
jgi:hypothetical protein